MKEMNPIKHLIAFLLFIFIFSFLSVNCISAKEKNRRTTETLHDIIDESLKTYTYKVGIFRITPVFKINLAYDNDALYSFTSAISDVILEAGPAINEKFVLGHLALIKLNQNVSYSYYNKLDKLRNFPYAFDVSVLTGRKTLLVNMMVARNQNIVRPTSESDTPANQLLQNGTVSLKFPFFMNATTSISATRNEYRFSEPYASAGYNVQTALSRQEDWYYLEFQKPIRAKTQFFIQAGKEFSQFTYESANRNHTGTLGTAGFIFGPSAFFTGYIKFGAKSLKPENASLASFKGFIMSGELEYRPYEAWKFKIGFIRQPQFSIYYQINNYYLQNQYSAEVIWAFRPKLAAGIGYLYGSNEYPALRSQMQNPVNVNLIDKYSEASLKTIYKFRKDLYIEGGIIYYRRNSNVILYRRNRTLFFVNLKYQV